MKNRGVNNIMKKSLMFILVMVLCFLFVGCKFKKEKETQKEFMQMVTNASSYCVEGIMESYYQDGRKQNEFTVKYKSPDFIKVTIKDAEQNDKQIILKNSEGVYVLIPSVNKNFKIKSTWPTNSSYPYLLQSISKDLANEKEPIITEQDDTYTVETKTSLHNDALAVKQKIIFDKKTALPKEVLVYDENSDLYIRVVFTKVDFEAKVSDDEFSVEKSMETIRLEYGEKGIEYDRVVSYPIIFPKGSNLIGEDTIKSTDGNDVRTIMKFSGDVGFTIIQEFIRERDVTDFQQETGEITTVLGNVAIIKSNGVQMFYQGVEYTIGSNDLAVMQMLDILAGYMTNPSK